MIEIRELREADAPSCDTVIRSLPVSFGPESGREDCARALQSEAGFVAVDEEAIIGFLTYVPRFDEAPRSPGWRSETTDAALAWDRR